MALVEEGGESVALCLMDGLVRAFDLEGSQGVLEPKFDFDLLKQHDADVHHRNHPCAIAANGRLVFTATTSPSMSVWCRQDPGEPYGHGDYVREPPPPMELRARFTALPVHSPRQAAEPRLGTALETLSASLEKDRLRLGGVPRMRSPFVPFTRTEDSFPTYSTLALDSAAANQGA